MQLPFKKTITPSLFFWMLLNPVWGQEYLFREFTPVDGLSHSTVFCTFQDQTGYLWFGTYETAHRYDGQTFHEPLKAFEISANRIRRITQDRQGRIWISTREGAICLENDRATLLKEAEGLSHHSITDIAEDSQGTLWFASENGISRLSTDKSWSYLTQEDGLPHPHVRRILPGKDNTFWLATLDGLAFFDGTYLQPIELDGGFQALGIYALDLDAQNRLWIGSDQGLFCLSDSGLQHFSLDQGLPSDSIWALAVDKQQRLWIGSDAGLCVVQTEDLLAGRQRIRRVSKDHYIAFTTIYSIDQDREGNLWFGTCIGLFQLNTPELQAFDFAEEEVGEMVLSMAETDPGTIWIGTDRGVLRMQSDRVEDVTSQLNLPDTFIRCMLAAPDSGVWFGTRSGAAYRGPNQPITLDRSNGLPDQIIFSMSQDEDGWLYLGTQDRGLAAWREGEVKTWGLAEGLSGLRIHCIEPHPLGGMFIGTDRGLDWLKDDQLTRVPLPLPSSEIYDIVSDQKGTIWVGTNLGVISLADAEATIYQRSQGLPDNRCRQLVLDAHQRLWIGTSRGLALLSEGRFTNFHPPPPTSPFEMNHGAAFADYHGNLWFGHYRGALRFQPLQDESPLKPLPIFLTGVSVFDEPYPTHQSLKLKYNRNQITFAFQGLYFSDPERIKYRYRLTGSQQDWQESEQTEVSYRHLKPGDYQFQVHSGDPNGRWSPKPATLSFSIRPPFWAQWWFRLLSIFVLAAFVAWQFQQLRLRNRLLTQETAFLSTEVARQKAVTLEREAEVKLLHSQMNPHFLQNAFANAIYLVKAEPKKAEDMLHQLSQLFRRTMQAKRQVWTTVGEDIALIKDYLAIQKVRFGERLKATIDYDPTLETQKIPAFILQPFVENACIHGQKENLGTLEIDILCKPRDTGIYLAVSNTGQPFPGKEGPSIRPGHALDNINKRLALLNQQPVEYCFQNGKHQFSVIVELA